MIKKSVFIGLIFTLFVSCTYNKMAERLIPKEESAFARTIIDAVIANDYKTVSESSRSDLYLKLTDTKFKEIHDFLPQGKVLSCEIVGSQVHTINGDWQASFTYEYGFEDSNWILANVVLVKQDDKLLVAGLNFYAFPASQKEINKFTLYEKTTKHLLILLCAILFPLFSIFTFVVCLKTPFKKRKVLWAIFILIGITSITINWTSGQVFFNPLVIKLLSASATASSPYSPWNISFSIPLGALLFWIKRYKIKKDD